MRGADGVAIMTRGVFVDRKGLVYGKLKVKEHLGVGRWLCVCSCGKETIARGSDLESGKVQSCGCLQKERSRQAHTIHGRLTHNGERPRLYNVWKGMRSRCNNVRNPEYKYYGGRGIRVCDEWDSYPNFEKWAYQNGYDESAPKGKCTIDRIDNDGDYEPSNCRWVDMSVQSSNRRHPKFPSRRKPVEQIDEHGNVLNFFNSIQEAAEATGCNQSKITAVCKGRRNHTLGIQWRYANRSDSKCHAETRRQKATEQMRMELACTDGR